MMDLRKMSFWYAVTLSIGLSLGYASLTGVVTHWLFPIALFLLVGWVTSILFVIVRVMRRKRSPDPRQ